MVSELLNSQPGRDGVPDGFSAPVSVATMPALPVMRGIAEVQRMPSPSVGN